MHRTGSRIALAPGRSSRADRRLTTLGRRLLHSALAFLAAAPALFAELSTAEIEDAADAGRRAALLLLQGAQSASFRPVLATDSIVERSLAGGVWRELSDRQRERLRAIVADRFVEALAPRRGAVSEIAWSSARADGNDVLLFLGLRYPEGVLKTGWALSRAPSGWRVSDVLLVDPGVSLAAEATRSFGKNAIRRRDRGQEAWRAALPHAAGILAIVAIVAIVARRLAPPARRILLVTAVAPAVLFALDGFFAVRRAVSEPHQIPEVLTPDPWRAFEREALAAEREGRLDDARHAWERAVAAGAPPAPAEYQLGVALRSAGRIPEAKEVFRRALTRSPTAPGARKELGLIALTEGRSDEAGEELRRYLSEAGPDPDALSALAVAAANVGDNRGAVAAIGEARMLLADRWTGAHLQSQVYARAGDAEKAIKTLRALEADGQVDREALRSDPAYLPIATDPAWVRFLAETPAPER